MHELDVTNPADGAGKAPEEIHRYRTVKEITAICQELLDVTQNIVNDLAVRLGSVAK